MSDEPRPLIRYRIDAVRKDDTLKVFEKWRNIGHLVVADLKKVGRFFHTAQGPFVFDEQQRRTFPLTKNPGLSAVFNDRYGINPREHGFDRVLADLETEAELHGEKVEIRRVAHYEKSSGCLYVSRFDGYVYRLNGTSVELVDNGTDNVFFDDHPNWEPYSYSPDVTGGKIDELLIEAVNFSSGHLSVEDQRKLLKLWLHGLFFGSLQPTKIILLLLGVHGSGKTSALRRIQKFLFGNRAELLSIEKDKPDGFIATVTSDPIALFDNLDERIPWLPYNLSRLATGVSFSRRQLYTTNTKVEYPGVCWLGITARNVSFMQEQEDLPDRALVLKVDRLEKIRPETDLLAAIHQHRNALWSEILDDLNCIVHGLHDASASSPLHFRMADFAALSLSISSVWGWQEEVQRAFGKLEHAQAELILEDDPIHQVLRKWLAETGNEGRMVDAGTLQTEWSKIAEKNGIAWPFKNGRSLGQRLGQLRHTIQLSVEMKLSEDLHAKQKLYSFRLRESQDAVPQKAPEYKTILAKLLTKSIPALPAERG